jgi:hypothetical protein
LQFNSTPRNFQYSWIRYYVIVWRVFHRTPISLTQIFQYTCPSQTYSKKRNCKLICNQHYWKVKVNVKQPRYRPGVAQRIPES